MNFYRPLQLLWQGMAGMIRPEGLFMAYDFDSPLKARPAKMMYESVAQDQPSRVLHEFDVGYAFGSLEKYTA